MNSSEFRHLPEWELIREALLKQLVVSVDAALAAPSLEAKEYSRAYAEAIKDFLALPDAILPKSDDESDLDELNKEDSLGQIYLANRPNKELY